MVNRIWIWAFSAILLVNAVFISGCSKDELSEPATITCTFEIQSETAMSGMLTFQRVDFNISRFGISGNRMSGGDMYFTRNFNSGNGRFALLDNISPSTVLQIPQGSYSSLVFYTSIREEDYEFEFGNSENEDDETGDLAEYIANAKPGLLMVGYYSNGSVEFPVIISLNDDIGRLAVEAMQGGATTIVLQKDVPALGSYTFNPDHLFTSITTTTLEAALKFPLNGEQAVMISEEYNENIYNQLAGRMQGAVALTLEDQ